MNNESSSLSHDPGLYPDLLSRGFTRYPRVLLNTEASTTVTTNSVIYLMNELKSEVWINILNVQDALVFCFYYSVLLAPCT